MAERLERLTTVRDHDRVFRAVDYGEVIAGLLERLTTVRGHGRMVIALDYGTVLP